nr:ROK family protein [Candidatus Sigynarchaeota archaeon]
FSSGTAVAKHARAKISQDKTIGKMILGLAENDITRVSAKHVYEAARKGDSLAKEIVDQATYFNAMGIGLMNNFYDVKMVYLGGSMLKDEGQIIPPLQEIFAKHCIEYTINKPPQLKRSRLGDEVGLMGALALGKYKIEKDPVIS